MQTMNVPCASSIQVLVLADFDTMSAAVCALRQPLAANIALTCIVSEEYKSMYRHDCGVVGFLVLY